MKRNGDRIKGPEESITIKRIRARWFEVDMKMHQEHRERVRKGLNETNGFYVVHGGSEKSLYDTDTTMNVFQQESNFQYLFGVKEPDCVGAVHLKSGTSFLFIPRLPEEYQVWMGPLKSKEWFKERYCVDSVEYIDDMVSTLFHKNTTQALAEQSEVTTETSEVIPIYLLRGTNTDSGLKVQEFQDTKVFEEHFKIKTKLNQRFKMFYDSLYETVVESRLIKSSHELDLMRFVSDVSSDAHMVVMGKCKPGMREFQLESLFKHHCYYAAGCRHVAYTCICASGTNGAVLHYGHAAAPNTRKITSEDMCLFDMGAEYHRYASDITCSFPASGKFTKDQKDVYESVLMAQWSVMDAMKPGISWKDMHDLSYRVILTRLRDVVGVLRKDASVEDMMRANVASLFMMHGLGHLIGLNVHDVGGYIEGKTPKRPTKAGYRSLRICRVLRENMCLTVEPGIYFNSYALSKASVEQKKFLVSERLKDFVSFGGVRIEDVVVVTKNGIENLTNCPRTVSDVEAVMSGKITSRHDLTKKFYRSGHHSTTSLERLGDGVAV